MQPLGIPEWLLSITLGGIDNLLRCHRLLTPDRKPDSSCRRQPNVSKRQTEKKRLPYCDNFTIGRKKEMKVMEKKKWKKMNGKNEM